MKCNECGTTIYTGSSCGMCGLKIKDLLDRCHECGLHECPNWCPMFDIGIKKRGIK